MPPATNEPAAPPAAEPTLDQLLTIENLRAFAPAATDQVLEDLAAPLLAELAAGEITTPIRLAHFMAQAFVESWGLTRFVENMNYSALALAQLFPNEFPGGRGADAVARNPEAIGNIVYAGRFGNGDAASGDGYRYRGRGLFGTTFKDNYAEAGEIAGLDLVAEPELLHLPGETMVKVAVAFWTQRKANAAADADDLAQVTKLINGGENGLAAREDALKRAKACFVVKAAEPEGGPAEDEGGKAAA